MGVLDYETVPGDNTSINGINILGTSAVANFDNALRQLMADIATGIPAGQFMATGYVTKAAGYTVVVGDKGNVFDCTAALELDLPAAATAGAGFFIDIKANGGAVTVDPNGTENINGASTSLVIANGTSARVFCDGTAWHSVFTAAPAPDLSPYFLKAGDEAAFVQLPNAAAPGDPAADKTRLYVKADGKLAYRTSAGVETVLDPTTTRGDIIYRNATAPTRLAKGTEGQVLTMGADDPAWSDAPSPDYGAGNAALALGAIGTYALLRFVTQTTAAEGSTHAGSTIRYSNGEGNIANSVSPSGTWMLMGRTASGSNGTSTSVFLRIS